LQAVLVVGISALLAMVVGAQIAKGDGSSLTTPVLGVTAIAGAIVLFSVPPDKLFLGWLLLAPLFQNSADATTIGKPLVFAFYLAPAVALIAHTALGWRSDRRIRAIDVVPTLFVLYVFGSLVVTTSLLQDDAFGAVKAFYSTVAIGAVVYYFLAFGPGSRVKGVDVARVLLLAVLLQSLLSLLEWQTGWNLWADTAWQEDGLSRTVSTLANPAVLGVFIGTGIVLSLAILVWDGPRKLRRLAWLVVLVGPPAIMVTLTRAPIIATALMSVAVLVLSRVGRIPALAAIVAIGLALVAAWPMLTSSRLYEERIANRGTVDTRAEVQRVSVRLAGERPLTGHGYASFDEVRVTVGRTLGVDPVVLTNTSHNAYLTILVEYGAIGLVLFVLPLLVITFQAISRARSPSPERWFMVGAVAAIGVFCVSSAANDFRFFSLAQALPWIFLGLLRTRLDGGDPQSTS
jgi:O-antigen ligase